ncbi:penicillin-binding protein 2, partial [bacterium]|nr:penicillin-binding protein 2 [bacterium]
MPRKWTHNRAYKQAQYQQSRYRPTSFGYDSLGLSFDRVIRIRLVLVCIAVFCLALVARLYALQAYGSERWKLLALKQHQTTLEVMEPRASVADRNGQILAYSVPRVSLGIHPNLVQQPEKWSEALSLILDRPPSQIEAILKSQSRFAWLARSITKSQAEQVKQTKLPGLEFIQEYKREYPLGTLAGNLIGRIGADGQGLSGVELAFNHLLKADSYQLNLRRDARGQLVAPSRKQQTIFDATLAAASVDEVGNPRTMINQSEDLELTIDSSIQAIVEAEFVQGLSDTKAKRIFGTILDADSGEILALAQTPSYDPNQPLQDLSELRNAVIEDSFEPGSTLKPLVAALALDHAVATPNETIDCEQGRFRIGRHLIEDVHPLGIASFGDILVRSSNVGITKIGQRLGKEQLYHGIKSLGFGSLSGV